MTTLILSYRYDLSVEKKRGRRFRMLEETLFPPHAASADDLLENKSKLSGLRPTQRTMSSSEICDAGAAGHIRIRWQLAAAIPQEESIVSSTD